MHWPARATARRALAPILASTAVLGCAAAPAAALPGAKISSAQFVPVASYPGLRHLHYETAPLTVAPGQNHIRWTPTGDLRPQVSGYITRFRPNLIYTSSRKVPRVDVIHLHHGVWVIDGRPVLAAGEEKTATNFPHGYAMWNWPGQDWQLNYMIHNLTPTPTSVRLTYDIDFLPDNPEANEGITTLTPLWMDVRGIASYPVFDAIRGHGRNGRFTYPDDAHGSARQWVGEAQSYRVTTPMTLVQASGHLHPGGLHNQLWVTRNGQRRLLFRSEAKYFEPAGAVSWDVSMTATKPTWRVALNPGDVLSTNVTYDTSRASWYEAMGIMPVWAAYEHQPGAVDPFSGKVDTTGLLTHGHLPENDVHGGDPFPLPDPSKLADGFVTSGVAIKDFGYGRGDLNGTGKSGRPPVVKKGGSITFTNLDATPDVPYDNEVFHTITACRRPCNRSTGVAYPLADGRAKFDSKELGFGGAPTSGTNTWSTPKNLAPGTYTYFCRVHPFMRGAFRVKR